MKPVNFETDYLTLKNNWNTIKEMIIAMMTVGYCDEKTFYSPKNINTEFGIRAKIILNTMEKMEKMEEYINEYKYTSHSVFKK